MLKTITLLCVPLCVWVWFYLPWYRLLDINGSFSSYRLAVLTPSDAITRSTPLLSFPTVASMPSITIIISCLGASSWALVVYLTAIFKCVFRFACGWKAVAFRIQWISIWRYGSNRKMCIDRQVAPWGHPFKEFHRSWLPAFTCLCILLVESISFLSFFNA